MVLHQKYQKGQKGFMKQMKYKLSTLKNQVFSEEWCQKVSSLLPKNIDEQLKLTGSFKRFRGICDGISMLRMYFAYAISKMSFAELATTAHSLGLAKMSDTSWRKRLLKIVPLLETIISYLLKSFIETVINPYVPKLKLVDATNIRLQGKDQHLERIHFSYDLNNNRIDQLKVTDKHVPECFSHFSMKRGEIFIADAGYATVNNCVYAIKRASDFIIRLNPQLPLYDIMENRIDYKKLRPAGKEKIRETRCFILERKTGKTYLVRVIVGKIPPNKVITTRKRKSTKAKKKQRKLKAETLFNAAFVFLITSLTEENYGANAILELYRSRWQIELLFKCFKQNLGIKTIRIASPKYARVMIYLWLIIFLITERNLIKCKITLEDLQEMPHVSLWKIFKISFIRIKSILELQVPYDELPREFWIHLATHKRRKRKNQNDNIRRNLIPQLSISGLIETFKEK